MCHLRKYSGILLLLIDFIFLWCLRSATMGGLITEEEKFTKQILDGIMFGSMQVLLRERPSYFCTAT